MCAGTTFSNLGGTAPPIAISTPGSTASFSRCSFASSATNPVDPSSSTSGPNLTYAFAAANETALRLEGCEFTGGTPNAVRVDAPGAADVFSDSVATRVLTVGSQGAMPSAAARGLEEDVATASSSLFLTGDDAQFVQAQEVWSMPVKSHALLDSRRNL